MCPSVLATCSCSMLLCSAEIAKMCVPSDCPGVVHWESCVSPEARAQNVGRQSPGGQRVDQLLPNQQPRGETAPQPGNRKLSVPRSTGAKCGSPVPWRPAGRPTPTQPTAPWGNRPPARQQKVECPTTVRHAFCLGIGLGSFRLCLVPDVGNRASGCPGEMRDYSDK